MRMVQKCRGNNNSDNPLTSRRTDGGSDFTQGKKLRARRFQNDLVDFKTLVSSERQIAAQPPARCSFSI